MKRNRHTEEQISILKANERGVLIAELARQNGVTAQHLYPRKARHEVIGETQTPRLQKLLVKSALDNATLRKIVSGKG